MCVEGGGAIVFTCLTHCKVSISGGGTVEGVKKSNFDAKEISKGLVEMEMPSKGNILNLAS